MILSTVVAVKISNNGRYWSSLGYICRQGDTIEVSVEQLRPASNIKVNCLCDDCGVEFIRKRRDLSLTGKHRCSPCSHHFGNKFKFAINEGPKHHNWNPNKSAFQGYSRRVRTLTEKTYSENLEILNPNKYPRTRCGVEGGYQLDHKQSILFCFKNGISVEECASLANLQLLPWQDNRLKGYQESPWKKL